MSRPVLVRGGSVLDVGSGRWLAEDLLLAGGRVAARGRPGSLSVDSADVVDATGLLVTPGLVDAQVNGAAGADLTREPRRIAEVARALPRHGVTSFVPTVITAPAGTVEAALAAAAALPDVGLMDGGLVDGGAAAARVVGVHAEGPFLAPARRGAHPAEHLRLPDRRFVEGWTREAGVVTATVAPELPGALDVIRDLVARGVTVWLGHTESGYDDAVAAVDAGARGVTHLFNAMPWLDHRAPGLVGAALGDRRLVAGIIVDGYHVHPAAVRTAWNALGDGRFMLVSDTTAALGLPSGRTVLGDQDVVLEGDVVRLAYSPGGRGGPGGRTLAGSAVGLDHCVRTLVAMTGCDPARAFVCATRVPADLLGRPDLGRLDVGAVADVALWAPGLTLAGLMLAGRPVATDAHPDDELAGTSGNSGCNRAGEATLLGNSAACCHHGTS